MSRHELSEVTLLLESAQKLRHNKPFVNDIFQYAYKTQLYHLSAMFDFHFPSPTVTIHQLYYTTLSTTMPLLLHLITVSLPCVSVFFFFFLMAVADLLFNDTQRDILPQLSSLFNLIGIMTGIHTAYCLKVIYERFFYESEEDMVDRVTAANTEKNRGHRTPEDFCREMSQSWFNSGLVYLS